jgi:hypothetical protein
MVAFQGMDSDFDEFCFEQHGMVLIPIEHLSKDGIGSAFQSALLEKTILDREWIEYFNRAFSLYWERALDLHARAPQFWLPPRVQHVCVYTATRGMNPFTQLFNRSSWSLEACDFHRESSSSEYAIYQFFHAERVGMLRQLLPALVSNLSYFLTLSADQLQDFREGCFRSKRGDASGFRALAEATDWISRAYHQPINEPSPQLLGHMVLPYGGLIMPKALEHRLIALQDSWARAAQAVLDGYFQFYAKPSPAKGRKICDWLVATRPALLIAGKEHGILWDPEQSESIDDLLPQLQNVTEQAEERIIKDLEVVDHHSRRFLKSLREPDGLVNPPHFMTPGGLSYIHPTRKLVVYSIHDERNNLRLVEPAPPFERLLLGARTMHEWGHLSAESLWVRVPAEAQARHEELRAELASLIEALHAGAPPHVRSATTLEFDQLKATSKSGSPGRLLVKKMIVRSEDFQANLLSQRYLRTAEIETYIRNNVYSLVTERETTGVYARMLRYAYQYQYLRLSSIDDPLGFFLKSSWFAEEYYRTGILSEEQFQQVLTLVGEICDCYAIDESKFDFLTLAD